MRGGLRFDKLTELWAEFLSIRPKDRIAACQPVNASQLLGKGAEFAANNRGKRFLLNSDVKLLLSEQVATMPKLADLAADYISVELTEDVITVWVTGMPEPASIQTADGGWRDAYWLVRNEIATSLGIDLKQIRVRT